jgi:hypothetical protein
VRPFNLAVTNVFDVLVLRLCQRVESREETTFSRSVSDLIFLPEKQVAHDGQGLDMARAAKAM